MSMNTNRRIVFHHTSKGRASSFVYWYENRFICFHLKFFAEFLCMFFIVSYSPNSYPKYSMSFAYFSATISFVSSS